MKHKRGKHPNTPRFKKGYIPWNKNMKYPLSLRKKVGRGHKKINGYKYELQDKVFRNVQEAIRDIPEYITWRKAVYQRDGYRCRTCDNTKHKIVAHHRYPFNKIFKNFLKLYPKLSIKNDWYKLVELSIEYSPFWDVENGITLCEDCHIKIHRKRKKRKNQENNI